MAGVRSRRALVAVLTLIPAAAAAQAPDRPAWEHIVGPDEIRAPRPPAPPSRADRAARLEEGRRRFFMQQQGFDHELPPPPIAAPNQVFPTDATGLTVPMPRFRR